MEDTLSSVWTHWHGHPEVLIGLSLLEGAYLMGVGPLRERFNLSSEMDPRQVATFTAGILAIFVALLSPIHHLADNFLFSVHMLQHVLLTLVAPPLLILGTPDWLIRPLLRPNWSFRLAKFLVHPLIAFVAFNMMFSIWHIPALYNASAENHLIHIGEHLLFMATAIQVWWPLTSNMPELPRLSYPLQLGYLFGLSIAQTIVFGIITFSQVPIYDFYVQAPRVYGISPLTDQQVGGIIMKVGSGVLFLTLFIIAFLRWFKREEEKSRAQSAERDSYGYR